MILTLFLSAFRKAAVAALPAQFEHGVTDYRAGQWYTQNPFKDGTTSYRDWQDGWNHARSKDFYGMYDNHEEY